MSSIGKHGALPARALLAAEIGLDTDVIGIDPPPLPIGLDEAGQAGPPVPVAGPVMIRDRSATARGGDEIDVARSGSAARGGGDEIDQ